mmetsp:Transcript_39004/g.79844  ORF Transcript_39004/g.79844 Transcript_39004/m.79844 type:complete len:84 (-) Transcript_39004:1923-2174(-)
MLRNSKLAWGINNIPIAGDRLYINSYINSPGGVVTAGMAMYDTMHHAVMQYVNPDMHTICMGQAASMGSLLLPGGSAGCRYAL